MKNYGMALSDLQKAALDQIRWFESALSQRNVTVRMSFEQKFLLPEGVELHGAALADDLQDEMPSLKSIVMQSNRKAQISFDGGEHYHHSPSEVALDTLRFQRNGEKMLGHKLEFKPYFKDVISDEAVLSLELGRFKPHHKQTLGLHCNLSVYDNRGNNLCNNPRFSRILTERELNMQYHAGLGYIQTKDNLKRLGSWEMMPDTIGLASHKCEGMSLVERTNQYHNPLTLRLLDDRYHETRLGGANNDPLVIAALQMAAIYDAVSQSNELRDMSTLSMELVDHKLPGPAGEIEHTFDQKIGRSMKPWVERFHEAENHKLGGLMKGHADYGLRQLLGNALYDGIDNSYGRTAQRRSR